jgi:hypothetical protein
LDVFSRCRLRRRTPGAPPFSSMNSMLAGFHNLADLLASAIGTVCLIG